MGARTRLGSDLVMCPNHIVPLYTKLPPPSLQPKKDNKHCHSTLQVITGFVLLRGNLILVNENLSGTVYSCETAANWSRKASGESISVAPYLNEDEREKDRERQRKRDTEEEGSGTTTLATDAKME